MITVSQDEYVRMLNLLKYQGKFILSNSKIDEIKPYREKSIDFILMLNDLDLTFTEYLNAKDKYQLTEETNKCISEAEQIKEQLDKLANDNFDVDYLFDNMGRSRSGC